MQKDSLVLISASTIQGRRVNGLLVKDVFLYGFFNNYFVVLLRHVLTIIKEIKYIYIYEIVFETSSKHYNSQIDKSSNVI